MKDEKRSFNDECEHLMDETTFLANVVKSIVKEVSEYSCEEIKDFIHDVVINDYNDTLCREVKLNYDLKCNIDIPNKGRVKFYIYSYKENKTDNIPVLLFVNGSFLLSEVATSNEDEGHDILNIYPIWIVQAKDHINIYKQIIRGRIVYVPVKLDND